MAIYLEYDVLFWKENECVLCVKRPHVSREYRSVLPIRMPSDFQELFKDVFKDAAWGNNDSLIADSPYRIGFKFDGGTVKTLAVQSIISGKTMLINSKFFGKFWYYLLSEKETKMIEGGGAVSSEVDCSDDHFRAKIDYLETLNKKLEEDVNWLRGALYGAEKRAMLFEARLKILKEKCE